MPEQLQQSDHLAPGVWKIVSVVVAGSFLPALDATVVNVSLSSLAAELHTRLSVIQWVTSGYLLALALMLPLNGWLVERIGTKRLYLICLSGFTLASALCALSWSANSLIGFRVFQGVSGGLMAPMAQLLLARVAGKNLVRVIGYAAVPILLAPLLGPVIAGAILQYASWRWLFLINLPIGVLAVMLAFCLLPDDHDQRLDHRELDLIGFFLLSPGLVLFLYGSERLGEHVGMAALLLSVILLAAFFRKALGGRERALIDLQLFRSRSFSASALTQFTVNGLSFAGQMLIPAYLIRAAGQSPITTGWLMAPVGLGMICTYPSLGRWTKRFGIRRTSAGGASLALLGTLPLLYLSGHNLNLIILAGALFMRGMGMSAVGIPSISAAYAAVRNEDLPMATTSLNIVQRVGGPTLTTFCATLLGWRLAVAHSHPSVASAFTISFVLLCCLHVLLIFAALRLPRSIDEAEQPLREGVGGHLGDERVIAARNRFALRRPAEGNSRTKRGTIRSRQGGVAMASTQSTWSPGSEPDAFKRETKGSSGFGEIVVFIDGCLGTEAILEFTSALAELHGARMISVFMQPQPTVTPAETFARGKGMQSVMEVHRAEREAVEAKHRALFEGIVRRHGIQSE